MFVFNVLFYNLYIINSTQICELLIDSMTYMVISYKVANPRRICVMPINNQQWINQLNQWQFNASRVGEYYKLVEFQGCSISQVDPWLMLD